MKKRIPYFKQPDNTHCFQACLKMVLKYFFSEKDFTFEELDKLSDKPKNKWTWPCASLIKLKNMGLKVKYYSLIDYNDFAKNGIDYIFKNYDNKVAEKIIRMSDIKSEIKNAKKMLKEHIFKFKKLSFNDVEKYFKENYIILLLINSRLINNKLGYGEHFVVLTGFNKNNVFIHDPSIKYGLPNRKVKKDLFIKSSHPAKNNVILIKR